VEIIDLRPNPKAAMNQRHGPGKLRLSQILGILAFVFLGAVFLTGYGPSGVSQLAGLLPGAVSTAGSFPLFVKVEYEKASGEVSVRGTTVPGAVVQVSNASTVVKQSGTYNMKTSLPLSLVAVNDGKIRRFRFDLPAKAKPHLTSLTVNADLSRMRTSVNGQLTITRHPPARIIVEHVQNSSKHEASITKGEFTIELPLVRGTNTLQWRLQLGIISSPGPDITFVAE
jgi:hypothetical protein